MALRFEEYAPCRATARFHEYSTSFDVMGSPLLNLAAGFSLTVYVRPSDEMSPLDVVGTSVEMSGTMFRLESKRQRLSNTFCMISVSTSASASPGSHVPGFWYTGNLRTCLEASPPPPVVDDAQAAATITI